MAIFGRKEKKLRRDISKKQEYQKKFGPRITRGDKSTPTYAQWAKAGATERGLMAAGVGAKKLRRMKRKP